MAQLNLGTALMYQGEWTGGTQGLENLHEAAAAVETASQIYGRDVHPPLWRRHTAAWDASTNRSPISMQSIRWRTMNAPFAKSTARSNFRPTSRTASA